MQSALPRTTDTFTHAIPLGEVPHHSALSIFKRAIDILGSLVGLTILVILFIPIALAIKLDSPGTVLYAQKRHGLMGQTFRIYKFRSMVDNADSLKAQVTNQAKGLIFKNDTDPRITHVGKFLRQTSLDELPQFWNVLIGEMSLVGTRPPTSDEVARYEPHHWQRLIVKPGMTGEWQVNGRSMIQDFEDVVRLDLHYQMKWHPFYDLFVIAKTFYVILAKVGAY